MSVGTDTLATNSSLLRRKATPTKVRASASLSWLFSATLATISANSAASSFLSMVVLQKKVVLCRVALPPVLLSCGRRSSSVNSGAAPPAPDRSRGAVSNVETNPLTPARLTSWLALQQYAPFRRRPARRSAKTGR